VNEPADTRVNGQELVGIAAVARAFRVKAEQVAAVSQQARSLLHRCGVERSLLAIAKDRRIHREEAHHAVHEETERVVVEERRTNREKDALPVASRHQVGDDHVEVEEAPVITRQDEALVRRESREALEVMHLVQATRGQQDPVATDVGLQPLQRAPKIGIVESVSNGRHLQPLERIGRDLGSGFWLAHEGSSVVSNTMSM
jgi:hypothetical protein